MKTWTESAALLALSSLLLGTALSQDSDLAGTVRYVDGQPLAGVLVTGRHHFPAGGADELRSKTDDKGQFELKSVGRVIFFTAPKFETLTRVRGTDESSVDVFLKPELEKRWPADCSVPSQPGKRYGSMFLFLVPRGTKVTRHSGTDTWDLVVSFPHSKTNERLILWSGPMLGDGFVPEETILGASSFTQQGFDWRGKSRDGKNWRWFSSIEDLIHYENASNDAARFFDRIIDSVCVKPLPPRATKQDN